MRSRSESTVVPPVTALRSPPLSRMTGADSPVMALSSTLAIALDHVAVAGDQLVRPRTRTISPLRSAVAGDRLVLGRWPSSRGRCVSVFGLAQRVRLRLAASFRHRLGEVGEQHREPEPQRDLADEQQVVTAA